MGQPAGAEGCAGLQDALADDRANQPDTSGNWCG
jgi:hypothetical protein